MPTLHAPKPKKHVLDSSSEEEGSFPNPTAKVFNPAFNPGASVFTPADAAGVVPALSEPTAAPEAAERPVQTAEEFRAQMLADEAADLADDAILGVGVGSRRQPQRRPASFYDLPVATTAEDPVYLSEESDDNHVGRHHGQDPVEFATADEAVNTLEIVVSAAAVVAEPGKNLAVANLVQKVPEKILEKALLPPLPQLKFKPSAPAAMFVFESAVQREEPYDHNHSIKRTWRPVVYKLGQEAPEPNVEGVCTASNPFGAAPQPKDKVYVLHNGVGAHLITMGKGRIRGLASDLSTDQKTLLKNDFIEALELWDDIALVTEIEMWKAIEASRYAFFNKSYGLADVNVAVKLLIPKWLALDAEQLMEQCWSVEAVRHFDGTSDIATKFLVKEPRTKTASAISAPTKSPSSGSGSGRGSCSDLSPLSRSRNRSPSPQKQVMENQTTRIDAEVTGLLEKAAANAAEGVGKTLKPASSAAVRTLTAPAKTKQTEMSLAENTRLTHQFDTTSAERERRAMIAMMLPPMPLSKPVMMPSTALPSKPKAAGPISPVSTAVKPVEAETKRDKQQIAHLQSNKNKTVVPRAAGTEEDLDKEQLKAAIQASKFQTKVELEERIRKLVAEKLKLDEPEEAEDSDEASEPSESDSEEEWDAAKFSLVQSQILSWHEKQRARDAHTSASLGDPDFDGMKLHLLLKHVDTTYEQGKKGKRKGQIPRGPKQADELFTRVIGNCGTCKRQAQDRKQAKRERALKDSQQAREDAEYTLRYQHRLTESEFESDGDHNPEKFCGVCKVAGGRPSHMGKNSLTRDPQDKDELRNCEGPDCTRAFHHECRSLVQATPDGCRRHGMNPLVHITCGRRLEPWLCRTCWTVVGVKQQAYDEKMQKEKEEKEEKESEKQAKRARRESSTSSSVKSSLYQARSRSSSGSPNSSASSARQDDVRVGGFSFLKFLETIPLNKNMRNSDKKKIVFDCQDEQQSSATGVRFKPQQRAKKAVSTEFNSASDTAGSTRVGAVTPAEDSAEQAAMSNTAVPTRERGTRARADDSPWQAEANTAAPARHGTFTPAEESANQTAANNAAALTSIKARVRAVSYAPVLAEMTHVAQAVKASRSNAAALTAAAPTKQARSDTAAPTATLTKNAGSNKKAHLSDVSDPEEHQGFTNPEREKRERRSEEAQASKGSAAVLTSSEACARAEGCAPVRTEMEQVEPWVPAEASAAQALKSNDEPRAQQAGDTAFTVDGMPWRTWAGLGHDCYDAETGPPPNSSEQVYEGALTEQGPVGENQRLYGKTREHLLTLVLSETGLSNKAAIGEELNKTLEQHMNVQHAVVTVADTYHIALPTVTQSFREAIPWDTDEAWENHWRRSQSGFIRSRSEARLTAKKRITGEAKVSEVEALEAFNRHFKTSGQVERSIVAAIKEGNGVTKTQQGIKASEIKASALALPANNSNLERNHQSPHPQTKNGVANSNAADAATMPPFREPESPVTKELRLQEEVEARADDLAFRYWVKEYHRKTKTLFTHAHGANEGDQQEHGGHTRFQGMEESDQSAKDVALDAIAAATGKAKRDVAPILEIQLKRFRGFADAVRATSELIRSPIGATSATAIAIEPSPAPSLMMGGGNGDGMQSSIIPQEPSAFFRTESPVQFSTHEGGGFFEGNQPNPGSNLKNRTLNFGVKHPRTETLLSLREIYAKTLHEESLLGG